MFLLDTNVVSELRRPHRTHRKVAEWADGVSPSDLFLSSISILELETGALLLAHRDGGQGRLIQRWIEERVLTAHFGGRYRGSAAVRASPRSRSKALQGFADRGDGTGPPPNRSDPEPS